jgi:hypothetical protein
LNYGTAGNGEYAGKTETEGNMNPKQSEHKNIQENNIEIETGNPSLGVRVSRTEDGKQRDTRGKHWQKERSKPVSAWIHV